MIPYLIAQTHTTDQCFGSPNPNEEIRNLWTQVKTKAVAKIIDHCKLGWESNCLTFHQNKAPIKTMSTAQARKPIYKSSLDIFVKYKKFLKIIDKNF